MVDLVLVDPPPQMTPRSDPSYRAPVTAAPSTEEAGLCAPCSVGGQKPDDTVAQLFILLLSWPQVAITFLFFYLYLLFLNPGLPQLPQHPKHIHLKSHTQPDFLSVSLSLPLLSTYD